MKNSKWIALLLCAAMACLTGCMYAGARVTPGAENTAAPDSASTITPGAANSAMPDASGMPAVFDWMTMGSSVEDKLGMLSEIKAARVIVNDSVALVGVEFDDLYKGEMTERIHDMVAGEVQSADSAVQTVAVTAAPEDVKRINELADQIAAGTPVSQLESEIDSIIRNATTIQ